MVLGIFWLLDLSCEKPSIETEHMNVSTLETLEIALTVNSEAFHTRVLTFSLFSQLMSPPSPINL